MKKLKQEHLILAGAVAGLWYLSKHGVPEPVQHARSLVAQEEELALADLEVVSWQAIADGKFEVVMIVRTDPVHPYRRVIVNADGTVASNTPQAAIIPQ